MAKSNTDIQLVAAGVNQELTSPDSESDDDEIIETSPCSRWENIIKS